MSVKHQSHGRMSKSRSRSLRTYKYHTLSNDQLRKILEVSENDRTLRDLHDVVVILSNTGLRAGELRELRWADVDLEKRRLTVHPQKTVSLRYVPFGDKTANTLAIRRDATGDAGFVLGESPARVLARVAGQLRSKFASRGERAITLRVLRHTFFTRLMASGADILSLVTIGGWKLDRFRMKTLLGPAQRHQAAARDQERLERQE